MTCGCQKLDKILNSDDSDATNLLPNFSDSELGKRQHAIDALPFGKSDTLLTDTKMNECECVYGKCDVSLCKTNPASIDADLVKNASELNRLFENVLQIDHTDDSLQDETGMDHQCGIEIKSRYSFSQFELNKTQNDCVTILSCNVRSFNESCFALEGMAKMTNMDNTVITMSEVFRPGRRFEIEGTETIFLTRSEIGDKNCRGGVGIIFSEKWGGKKVEDGSYMVKNGCAEILTVKFESKKLLIMTIYRPIGKQFNNVEKFLEVIEEKMELLKLKFPNHRLIVSGDFNIDLLKCTDETMNLMAIMSCCGLSNSVTKPSRVSDMNNKRVTYSLIDHVWSDLQAVDQKILIDSPTDHYWLCTSFNKREIQEETSDKEKTKSRNLGKRNMEKILERARKENWQECVDDSLEIDGQWKKLEEKLSKIVNEVAPMKIQKEKRRQEKAPWFSEDLRKQQKKVERLHNKARLDPQRRHDGVTMKEKYKEERRKYKKEVKRSKEEYWQQKFEEAENSKETWKLINWKLRRDQNEMKMEKIKNKEGQLTEEDEEKANILNDFFATVGEKTSETIAKSERDPMESVKQSASEMTVIATPTQEDIEKIIRGMKDKNNNMESGVNMKIVKKVHCAISHILTQLIANSIAESVFPASLKRGEVIGLYKQKGDQTDPSNYRPITLTSPFSKIFEKWIEMNIRQYCEVTNALPESQHGFRANHSVDSMSIPMLEKIAKERDAGNSIVIVFADCSKAFDSISREILIQKLEKLGVKGSALELLRSYLTCRVQKVRVGSRYSRYLVVSCGVPQGSILGPLLYLLYCADMEEALKCICDVLLYADDTNTIHSEKTLNDAMDNAQMGLDQLQEWFRSNKVKTNSSKTKYIKITKEKSDEKQKLFLEGECLTEVTTGAKAKGDQSVSFVGLELDDSLNFTSHVNKILKRANFGLFGLSLIAREMSKKAKINVYHSLIQSHLLQNLIAYGRTTKKNLARIERIQRKGIRIVEGLKRKENVDKAMLKHKVLPISEHFEMLNCQWAAKVVRGDVPIGVSRLFNELKSRRAKQFEIPKFKSEKNKNLSPVVSISREWNKLPADVKEEILADQRMDGGNWAKRRIKRHFLDKMERRVKRASR